MYDLYFLIYGYLKIGYSYYHVYWVIFYFKQVLFMFTHSRLLGIVGALILSYAAWTAYGYFLDTSAPVVTITGIEPDEYYAGDVPCIVDMSDGYKVADLSVFLDGNALVSHFKVNRKHDEHVFTIPTKTLTNGPHDLKITVRDGSYRKNSTTESFSFIVDNRPLLATFVKSETDIKVFQGRTLHVQFQVNKPIQEATVRALSRTFTCIPEAEGSLIYECFIPISTQEIASEYVLSIDITDFVGNTATLDAKFQIVMYPFKKQIITIAPDKLQEAKDTGLPEGDLETALKELTAQSPTKKLWHGSFYAPIEIKSVSTDFGTIRTTQHRGKYAHDAVDLIGTPKTVVWAPQDGKIVLKERYAHSGNTVVIDHGCGILSLFYHLDSFGRSNVGDIIRKGNPIGTLGKTGHATGYHLHWEMRINNVAIDPLQWIKNDF